MSKSDLECVSITEIKNLIGVSRDEAYKIARAIGPMKTGPHRNSPIKVFAKDVEEYMRSKKQQAEPIVQVIPPSSSPPKRRRRSVIPYDGEYIPRTDFRSKF